jgi:hypothetical protein
MKPKNRFNGLKLALLNKILVAEERRIQVNTKEVSWENFTGKTARIQGFTDGLEDNHVIHVSHKVNNYCNYLAIIRHELHHLKHSRLRIFLNKVVKRIRDVTGLSPHRFFSWIYEFPARRYENYKFREAIFQSNLCDSCPT